MIIVAYYNYKKLATNLTHYPKLLNFAKRMNEDNNFLLYKSLRKKYLDFISKYPMIFVDIGLIYFAILIVIHAGSWSLSYDEAHSFLYYVERTNFGFLSFYSIANNHPLYSLLMTISTKLYGHSEIALRLPSILSGLIYLYICRIVISKSQFKAMSFALLILIYLIIGFFSLARGYGLAVTLLALGFIKFNISNQHQTNVSQLLFFVLLATFSIYTTTVFLYSVLLVVLVKDFLLKGKAVLKSRIINKYSIIGLLPLISLLVLSIKSGENLYGSEDFWQDGILYFVNIYAKDYLSIILLLSVFAFFIGLIVYYFKQLSSNLQISILSISIGIIIWPMFSYIFSIKYPTGRLLIPYIFLVNFILIMSVIEIYPLVKPLVKKLVSISSYTIFFILAFNYFMSDYKLQGMGEDLMLLELTSPDECLDQHIYENPASLYYEWRYLYREDVDLSRKNRKRKMQLCD